MDAIYLISFFIVGLFLGSFFCVVGLRLSRNETFVTGKSHCDRCQHPLKWYDLIPLLSFVLLRGKCRYCKTKINPLLFFIELFTGILFMIAYYSFGFQLELITALLAVSLTMIVIASDLTYLIIPDEVLVFFSVLFLVVRFLQGGLLALLTSLGSGALLFLFMYALMCFGNALFKKESLGGGDVKLLFVIGLVLDPFLGMLSVFLASFVALPISLLLYHKSRERVIPFGPFLLFALLVFLFSKVTTADIFNFLSFLALANWKSYGIIRSL